MTSYLIRRLFHAVIVVIGVTIITFGLQNVVATGPSLARAVIGPKATPGEIRRFLNEYGLSRSLPEQYFHFVWQLLQGNLGYSYKLNESINSIVGQELPRDVLLVGTSLVIAIVVGVAGGLFQATRRNTIFDYVGTALSFVFYSMPIFWLGLLLIQGFSITLHVFPSEAPQSFNILHVIAHPAGLVLPIATLTLVNVALFSRYGRIGDDQRAKPGLHPNGQGQGREREADLDPARFSELAPPGRHDDRPRPAGNHHRRPHR